MKIFKKIIATILLVCITVSFCGCDLLLNFFEKEEVKPIPPVDKDAPVYMEASGILTLQDVKREETENGFATATAGSSQDYKVSLRVVLDGKDNNNNKIEFLVYDRINTNKVLAYFSYLGKYNLVFGDLTPLGFGKIRYENFNLNDYIKSIDFDNLVPPEFEDMIPPGVEIEVDFEKVDMMDYLMSILYSMDTTALVISDKTLADALKEGDEPIEYREPFEITVGVFSKDGLFDSLKINYALSQTKVFEIKINDMKFQDGTINPPLVKEGIDIEDKDPFSILKESFEQFEIGEGVTVTYELNNGYVLDEQGKSKTVQNQLRIVKRSTTECEIDIYQRIKGQGAYNHIFNVKTYDFEEFELTLQKEMAYVIEDEGKRANIKGLIDYVGSHTFSSSDINFDTEHTSSSHLFKFAIENYDGMDIKQSSLSTALTYYLLAQTVNSMQNDIINNMLENGYFFNSRGGETISHGIARAIMDDIGQNLKKSLENISSDSVLGNILGGLLGGNIAGEAIDKLYEEASKELITMMATLLNGCMPLPELQNFAITTNFDSQGQENITVYGDNEKEDDDKRFIFIEFKQNLK